MAATDPQSLMNAAKCYVCTLSVSMAEAMELALLAAIAEAGGGGGGSTQIYSTVDADPNVAGIVPVDPTRGAEFYQDPTVTPYNRWAWSITGATWIQYIAP